MLYKKIQKTHFTLWNTCYCYYYTPLKLFLLDPSVWVSCKPGNKVFNILQFFHNFQPVIWRPRPGDGMKSKLMHWNVNETATWLSWKSYQSIVEKNHNYKTWSLKLMGFGIDWGTLTRTKKPQWVCFLYIVFFPYKDELFFKPTLLYEDTVTAPVPSTTFRTSFYK